MMDNARKNALVSMIEKTKFVVRMERPIETLVE